MHLAFNKAAALVQELEQRQCVADLSREEQVCYSEVMAEAVATAKQVLIHNGF